MIHKTTKYDITDVNDEKRLDITKAAMECILSIVRKHAKQKRLDIDIDEVVLDLGIKPKSNTKNATTYQRGAIACYNMVGDRGLQFAQSYYTKCQSGNLKIQYEVYISAMREVLGLNIPAVNAYKHWEDAVKVGGKRIMHDAYYIVTDFPSIMSKDDEYRAHSENGPALAWRDGLKYYYWHGQSIPHEWVEDKENLNPTIAITWPNIEQRRAAAEIIGWDKIITKLGGKVIDADPDPEIGELIEVNIPDVGRERFLRVKCGTGRTFSLPVPHNMRTAMQAQAWTWGLDEKTFIPPEIRT